MTITHGYKAQKGYSEENEVVISSEDAHFLYAGDEEIVIGVQLCPPPGGADEPYALYNVMGQEDRFRSDSANVRILNPLTGRIVWTTTRPTTGVIHYGPMFFGPIYQHVVSTPERFHEEFIPGLNPNTEYVFYLDLLVPSTGETETTDYYYFDTSGEFFLGIEVMNPFVSLELLDVESHSTFVSGLSVIPDFVLTPPVDLDNWVLEKTEEVLDLLTIDADFQQPTIVIEVI